MNIFNTVNKLTTYSEITVVRGTLKVNKITTWILVHIPGLQLNIIAEVITGVSTEILHLVPVNYWLIKNVLNLSFIREIVIDQLRNIHTEYLGLSDY